MIALTLTPCIRITIGNEWIHLTEEEAETLYENLGFVLGKTEITLPTEEESKLQNFGKGIAFPFDPEAKRDEEEQVIGGPDSSRSPAAIQVLTEEEEAEATEEESRLGMPPPPRVGFGIPKDTDLVERVVGAYDRAVAKGLPEIECIAQVQRNINTTDFPFSRTEIRKLLRENGRPVPEPMSRSERGTRSRQKDRNSDKRLLELWEEHKHLPNSLPITRIAQRTALPSDEVRARLEKLGINPPKACPPSERGAKARNRHNTPADTRIKELWQRFEGQPDNKRVTSVSRYAQASAEIVRERLRGLGLLPIPPVAEPCEATCEPTAPDAQRVQQVPPQRASDFHYELPKDLLADPARTLAMVLDSIENGWKTAIKVAYPVLAEDWTRTTLACEDHFQEWIDQLEAMPPFKQAEHKIAFLNDFAKHKPAIQEQAA